MSIKVLVALNGAFLPLQTHLSLLPANAHSERLRSLASMGLLIQSGHLKASVAAGPIEMPGKAEGKDSYLRFPVVLNEAYPDLHAEMERTPVRLRAERLRALASLGLHAVATAAQASSASPAPVATVIKETEAKPMTKEPSAVATEQRGESAPPVMAVEKSQDVTPKTATPSVSEQGRSEQNGERIRPKKNPRLASFAKSLGI